MASCLCAIASKKATGARTALIATMSIGWSSSTMYQPVTDFGAVVRIVETMGGGIGPLAKASGRSKSYAYALAPVGNRGGAVGEAARAVEVAAMAAGLAVGEGALVLEGTIAQADVTTG